MTCNKNVYAYLILLLSSMLAFISLDQLLLLSAVNSKRIVKDEFVLAFATPSVTPQMKVKVKKGKHALDDLALTHYILVINTVSPMQTLVIFKFCNNVILIMK